MLRSKLGSQGTPSATTQRMSRSRIPNSLRAVFLLSTLVCATLAAVWPWIYPSISKLDWILVKLHTRDAQDAFERARDELEAGRDSAALGILGALAEDLKGVRRGDRLSSLRTSTLDLLAETHQNASRWEESLLWTNALLDYDPRDFVSMLRRVDLLEVLGRSDQAFLEMQAAFALGSTSGPARLKYIDMLSARGERELLARALFDLGLRGPLYVPLQGWELMWCSGDDMDFRSSAKLRLDRDSADGLITASSPVPGEPATVRGLRIDLPPGSLVTLSTIRCDILVDNEVATTLTEADIVHRSHFGEERSLLTTTGGVDPFVVLYRADTSVLSGVTGFRASVGATSALSTAAKDLLTGPFEPRLRSEWVSRYGEAAVLALESIQ